MSASQLLASPRRFFGPGEPTLTSMSDTLTQPNPLWRGSLLTLVIGAHAASLLLLLTFRTLPPTVEDTPLTVDLLQPPAPQPTAQPKPLPVAAQTPQKARPTPQPQVQQPRLEPTRSQAASSDAPAAPSVAPAPAAPAAAAAPAAESSSPARFDADYLNNPPPPYPPLSKRMGEEGRVILRVLVTPQGAAETLEVKTSSGSPRLDTAAVNTVRNWRFVPARRGEAAVQSWVLVPIVFKLEK